MTMLGRHVEESVPGRTQLWWVQCTGAAAVCGDLLAEDRRAFLPVVREWLGWQGPRTCCETTLPIWLERTMSCMPAPISPWLVMQRAHSWLEIQQWCLVICPCCAADPGPGSRCQLLHACSRCYMGGFILPGYCTRGTASRHSGDIGALGGSALGGGF